MEKFSKGSLGKIGGETERTSRHHRNEDIDDTRTPLNYYYKKSDDGLNHQWKSIVETTNATFKETKKSIAFEGMIITSDKSFFEKLGYLRHTFATVCQQFVRPDIVDIWMGDSSERLVGRVYTHFPDKFMKSEMDKVIFEF